MKFFTYNLSTVRRNEFINIDSYIYDAIKKSNTVSGILIIYSPHTTSAITINENADPNISSDFFKAINKAIPEHNDYLHDRIDNNAHAHIKSSIVGSSLTLVIEDNELLLGTWQDIMLVDFDGPRTRKVFVKIIEG